jgi:Fic family protein
MPSTKPDTTGGFRPSVALLPAVARPATDCIRADGQLDAAALSPAVQKLLLRSVRVRNIVSSMLIEGERVELTRAIRVLDTAQPDTVNERAVLQISRLYDRLASGRFLPLTLQGIADTHKEAFEGVLDEDVAGLFKTRANAIVDVATGRILIVPTPPQRVRAELSALLKWLDESRHRMAAPILAGVFFAEFQAIHPFLDGNGRIGRLYNLSLLAELGMPNAPLVPLDSRFYQTRKRYYELLVTTNSGRRYDLWLRYFVGELRHAYRLAVARSDLRPLVEQFRGRAVRDVLTWALSGGGEWFSHGDFPNPARFSLPAVTQALALLRKEGILESKGERRGRMYRLRADYLSRLQSGSPF